MRACGPSRRRLKCRPTCATRMSVSSCVGGWHQRNSTCLPISPGSDGTRLRVGLVACSKTKADRPTTACELYRSPLFRAARAYAERSYHTWLILSARHGAVRPTSVLEPYDATLARMPSAKRQAWARRVY